MNRHKHAKKTAFSVHNILFWTVGILLTLTMLSTVLVGRMFAKYVISSYMMDSAQVAKAGVGTMKLLEHEIKLDNGIYTLTQEEVTGNTYNRVMPGVDIAKDPFIQLAIDSDVTYDLYIKVAESSLPDTVTYALTADWIEVDAKNGIYKYKNTLPKQFSGKIKILDNDKLIVSESYDAQSFTLTFSAWLAQSNPNQTP